MDIEAAQEMSGDIGQASLFFITVADPDLIDVAIANIQEVLPSKITKMEEYLSLMLSSSVPVLDDFLAVVVGVAVAIGLLVIFLSTYTTITERTREIGILRSMGASRSFIVTLILNEAVILAAGGVLAGIGLSFALVGLLQVYRPAIQILIVPSWIIYATLLALGSSLLGALYPSIRAASQDPVESLAYE